MGTIGCSTALINTATKLIKGEKYTSDDLIQLAQGLAGGIVAGKQWGKQIGDAKLASKLSGKAATKANASFDKNVVIDPVDSYNIARTKQAIHILYDKSNHFDDNEIDFNIIPLYKYEDMYGKWED